jgi:hypothetical protein
LYCSLSEPLGYIFCCLGSFQFEQLVNNSTIARSIVSWISRSTVTNSNLECKPNDIQGPKIPVCDRRPEHFQGDTLTVMHVSFTRIVPDDPVGHDDLFSIL